MSLPRERSSGLQNPAASSYRENLPSLLTQADLDFFPFFFFFLKEISSFLIMFYWDWTNPKSQGVGAELSEPVLLQVRCVLGTWYRAGPCMAEGEESSCY